MDYIKTEKVGEYTIGVYYDEVHDNPRDWECNMGVMCCGHKRYIVPAEDETIKALSSVEAVETYLNKVACIWMPIRMYDHSGVALATGLRALQYPFNDPWDSGLLGWIYTTKAKIRDNYGVKRVTDAHLDKARSELVHEVETYGKYMNGEVYGYSIQDAEGETVESCGGYYGIDECLAEARHMVPEQTPALPNLDKVEA